MFIDLAMVCSSLTFFVATYQKMQRIYPVEMRRLNQTVRLPEEGLLKIFIIDLDMIRGGKHCPLVKCGDLFVRAVFLFS